MAKFQYIALDGAGKEQRGTIEAGDRASAIAAIRAHGLFPSAIGEVKGAEPAAAKAPKAARGAAFCRQASVKKRWSALKNCPPASRADLVRNQENA